MLLMREVVSNWVNINNSSGGVTVTRDGGYTLSEDEHTWTITTYSIIITIMLCWVLRLLYTSELEIKHDFFVKIIKFGLFDMMFEVESWLWTSELYPSDG